MSLFLIGYDTADDVGFFIQPASDEPDAVMVNVDSMGGSMLLSFRDIDVAKGFAARLTDALDWYRAEQIRRADAE